MKTLTPVPPHDESIENALLSGVIYYPDEYHRVETYISNGNVFYQTRARRLWRLIGIMKRNGEEISMPSICASISKDDENEGLSKYYVTEITGDLPLRKSVEYYARKIHEKYLLREVINATYKIQQKAYDNKINAYDEIISAHTYLGQLMEFKPGDKFDIQTEMDETVESIQDDESKLIKTGYDGLDKLAGGLTRGEITVIGGRPGHGKTTFLVNLLANMVGNGYKCILFNRELPNSELLKKLITLESGKLSYTMVRKGIFDDTGIKELEKIKQFIIKKYNSKKLRMFDNIRDFPKAAAEIKKFRPDVILDDYIQLISPTRHIEQRRLQLEALVNDYKWLAKEHKCVVMLASQLNRSLETRSMAAKPQLSDLAESGAIEQVAENVFFTYYDYKINGNQSKGKNIISIVARKVRYGETGECDLGFNGDKARFYNTMDDLTEDIKEDMQREKEDLPF
jgi:replicative DNA helicase|tara:strand:+ start:898 stop:2262 length:1365 start_codon:yes stop_codon:yes gene_type:complete